MSALTNGKWTLPESAHGVKIEPRPDIVSAAIAQSHPQSQTDFRSRPPKRVDQGIANAIRVKHFSRRP